MTKRISFSIAVLAALLVGACAPASTTSPTSKAAATTTIASEAVRTASGTFIGKSNHVTTGGGSVARVDGQWVVILEGDFFFDGAPDPRVALGSNGFRKDATLAPLAASTGEQVYVIPAGLDVADFNEIWIWCEKFSVPLGVAKLSLS